MSFKRVEEAAPAKINLALHITGRRADGYHLLDTLVVFAEAAGPAADRVSAAARPGSGDPVLVIEGPEAAALDALDPADNLVLSAARALAAAAPAPPGPVSFRLQKRLPIAAGLGGGSADAAAALRALDRLWRLDLGNERLAAIAATIGADVPMCLTARPARVGGIGERIRHVRLPALDLVLVNPRVAVATAEVFRRLTRRDSPGLPDLPAGLDAAGLAAYLAATRNDLEEAAIALAPAIVAARQALAQTRGCLLARMSGSGATVFGLFGEAAAAATAAAAIAARHPGWWVTATRTGSG